eukprot:9375763-Karenia_brevis.AAC.1
MGATVLCLMPVRRIVLTELLLIVLLVPLVLLLTKIGLHLPLQLLKGVTLKTLQILRFLVLLLILPTLFINSMMRIWPRILASIFLSQRALMVPNMFGRITTLYQFVRMSWCFQRFVALEWAGPGLCG